MGEAKRRRQEEKKLLESNHVWSDVNNIAAQCRALLMQYAQLLVVLKNPTLMAFVKDRNSLANHVKILAKDLIDMHNQLNELDKVYASERQEVRAATMESMMAAIELNEKYVQFVTLHEGVISPNYNAIVEAIRVAEHLMHMAGQDQGEVGQAAVVSVQAEIRAELQTTREVVAEQLDATTSTVNAEDPSQTLKDIQEPVEAAAV